MFYPVTDFCDFYVVVSDMKLKSSSFEKKIRGTFLISFVKYILTILKTFCFIDFIWYTLSLIITLISFSLIHEDDVGALIVFLHLFNDLSNSRWSMHDPSAPKSPICSSISLRSFSVLCSMIFLNTLNDYCYANSSLVGTPSLVIYLVYGTNGGVVHSGGSWCSIKKLWNIWAWIQDNLFGSSSDDNIGNNDRTKPVSRFILFMSLLFRKDGYRSILQAG